MSSRFPIHVQGSSHYIHSSTHSQEPLPASNDSWTLKLKPSVSYESVASSFLFELFQMINSWTLETRQDAFARSMYACISTTGPSPNLFYPSLGVFSSEIAMHTIIFDAPSFFSFDHA